MDGRFQQASTGAVVAGSRDAGRADSMVGARVLSVVFPAYDEVENVSRLVLEIQGALGRGGVDYEIVAVDDGSTDGTFEALHELGEAVPELRVVRHRGNRGQSAAIASGVLAARGGWIAVLDGDGQNDPRDIPGLLESIGREREGSPLLVVGTRVDRRDSWVRRVSSRVANGIRRALLRDSCPDTGCGLKVFRREAFLALPRFDHMHRFLPSLFRSAGGEVVTVPVRHRPRTGGRSKYGVTNRLWVGIVDLLGVLWLQRRVLRAVNPPGIPPVEDVSVRRAAARRPVDAGAERSDAR